MMHKLWDAGFWVSIAFAALLFVGCVLSLVVLGCLTYENARWRLDERRAKRRLGELRARDAQLERLWALPCASERGRRPA